MRKPLSKKIRSKIYEESDKCCAYCGSPVDFSKCNIDHIHPVYAHEIQKSLLDPNREDNLAVACRRCNGWKSTLSVENFRKESNIPL